MTKQINTGVAELLLVKVPDYSKHHFISSNGWGLAFSTEGHTDAIIEYIEIPDDYELLGIAHELSEEVWATLVDRCGPDKKYFPDYESFMDGAFDFSFETATKSGLSLLRANEVYSENPYEYQRIWFTDCMEGHCGCFEFCAMGDWREAQQNTGKWIALKRN